MKTEAEIRRAIHILEAAAQTGCPCQSQEEHDECKVGQMLLTAARDALRFVLDENPAYQRTLEEMTLLTTYNRLHYGLRPPHQPRKEP